MAFDRPGRGTGWSLHLHRALLWTVAALHVKGKHFANLWPDSIARKSRDVHKDLVRSGGGFHKAEAARIVPSDPLSMGSHR